MKKIADAAAGILFHGATCRRDTAAAVAQRELHTLLADDGLALEIHSWINDGGPDGEQLYCVADLVAQRLTDQLLAGRIGAVIARDDAAALSFDSLAGQCERRGHDGAAAWCRNAAMALLPVPVRSSLSSIGYQGLSASWV